MSGKNDVLVARALGVVEICADVLVGVGKPLVPRADNFLPPGDNVARPNLPEGVVGLCVEEVDPARVQRVADVVERIGVEIAVDARDIHYNGIGGRSFVEQYAV